MSKKKNKMKIFNIFLILVLIVAVVFGTRVYMNGGGVQGVLMTALGQTQEYLEDMDILYVLLLRNK